MLQFFRKYQKYFFIVITTAVVFSFVFFGTYQTIAPVFGKKESKSYPSQMASFLDTEQWMISRRFFAANFLNDGVISKEFLETGMADLVVRESGDRLMGPLDTQLEKEKKYSSYEHPNIPSLSADKIWSVFAPELPAKLKAFQSSRGRFKERVELFLAQRNFPPAFLTQIIRYQEQNNSPSLHDLRLEREDIALFGYHSLQEWFGTDFVEVVASHIIDLAQMARKLGYKVSKEELLSELVARSQDFYDGLKDKIELPVHNGYGLFQLYLRNVGLTEEEVVKMWGDVTLFRRLMHAVGDAALVDPLPLKEFYAYAHENANIELYQLPKEFRLRSVDDLKQCEAYLAAVGTPCDPLGLPADYAPLATIEQKAPELVGRRYRLSFATTTAKALQSKVSIKETLQWECDPANWNLLQKQFPELNKEGAPFDLLEGLDPRGRQLVDTFARKKLVEAHPEWINEVLSAAPLEEKALFLNPTIKKVPFEGINDLAQLTDALEGNDELIGYTQDHDHYFRFKIEERGAELEVLSYKEARKEGFLAQIAERLDLTARLSAITEATPKAYKEKPYLYRFVPFLEQSVSQAKGGALLKQFLPEKKEKSVTRSETGSKTHSETRFETNFLNFDEIIHLEKGALSKINVDPTEGPYIYRVLSHRSDPSFPLEKIKTSQELLSREARYVYFAQILNMKRQLQN